MCYVSSEYHGICGDVVAIHKDDPKEPIIKPELLAISRMFGGMQYDLPTKAAPPMEAIYSDGTPEGYFEALLYERFLDALPYVHFMHEHWDIYMAKPPANPANWVFRVSFADWRPRVYFLQGRPSTIVACVRKIQNGLSGSSGRDEVYLAQYNFQETLALTHMFHSTFYTRVQGKILDDERYTDSRHCCVAGASSILIAREKQCVGSIWMTKDVLGELYG